MRNRDDSLRVKKSSFDFYRLKGQNKHRSLPIQCVKTGHFISIFRGLFDGEELIFQFRKTRKQETRGTGVCVIKKKKKHSHLNLHSGPPHRQYNFGVLFYILLLSDIRVLSLTLLRPWDLHNNSVLWSGPDGWGSVLCLFEDTKFDSLPKKKQ